MRCHVNVLIIELSRISPKYLYTARSVSIYSDLPTYNGSLLSNITDNNVFASVRVLVYRNPRAEF